MKGEPGGKGDRLRSGADPKAYGEGHEKVYGKRCFRHPSVLLNSSGICPRCMEIWDRFNNNEGEYKPVEWGDE